MQPFEDCESQVRSYCRHFDDLFARGKGSILFNVDGRAFLDFWSSAGSVNYGHNPERLKERLLDYLQGDGLCAGLDLHTVAKASFIQAFHDHILRPRKLDYRLQFTGPTGTSVVESAVKLARKFTGRRVIAAFTNGFHGMSSTSLGLTGNRLQRQPWCDPHVFRLPYDGYLGPDTDTMDFFEKLLTDASSGLDLPAAVILETVQCEGGINVARAQWLHRLRELTRQHGILLIVDDIQVGCGRAGRFFSFEDAGIKPDLVCLSKSLSGYGLPLSVMLIAPALDVWSPGEDNGTFRGNNLAFVSATEAICQYWQDGCLSDGVQARGRTVLVHLTALSRELGAQHFSIRGKGLVWGLECHTPQMARKVAGRCFRDGLLVETAGCSGQVLKIMPALNIPEASLLEGLDILSRALREEAYAQAMALAPVLATPA
ncbi:MAG: putative aminobutyrate--pyruvate aminotransferase protein [Paucimonas sp.]|nr:putative aminobutyrate--pyruvate aminotransferase protein [Paucimonas sp.]